MCGLYFLHIPRTSGTEIFLRFTKAINEKLVGTQIKWLGDDDFIGPKCVVQNKEPLAINSEKKISRPLLVTGHLAVNPIIEFPFISSYSIIRNPVERLESVVNHLMVSGYKHIQSHEEFEKFFFNNELGWYGGSYPGFDSQPNMQSAYLTGKMVSSRVDDPPDWRPNEQAFNLVGCSSSIEDVIEKIKINNIKISSIENRNFLIEKMQKDFFNKLLVNVD